MKLQTTCSSLALCPKASGSIYRTGRDSRLTISQLLTYHISSIFYTDTLDSSISDLVNMIVLMGKYTYCGKWRYSKPSFVRFINDLKLFSFSLKK